MKKQKLTIILSLLVLVLVNITLFLSLPFLANSLLLPKIIDRFPLTTKKIFISQFTPWHLQGQFHFKNEAEPVATAPNFDLRYNIKDILKGRLESLTLEGATLYVTEKKGKLSLNGIVHETNRGTTGHNKKLSLPFSVSKLMLKNCLLVVHGSSFTREYLVLDARLDFDMEPTTSRSYLLKSVKGDIAINGMAPIDTTFTLLAHEKGYSLSLRSEVPAISKLVRPIGKLDALQGKLELNTEVFFTTTPLQLENFEMEAKLSDFFLHLGELKLKNVTPEHTLDLRVSGNQKRVEYTLTNLSSYTPVKSVMQLNGVFSKNDKEINTTGSINIEMSNTGESVHAVTPILALYSAQLTPTYLWNAEINLQATAQQTLHLVHRDTSFDSGPLLIKAKGDAEKSTITVLGKDIVLTEKNLAIHLPVLRFTSLIRYLNEEFEANISSQIPAILFPADNIQLRGLSLTKTLHFTESSQFFGSGSFNIREIHASDTTLGSLTTNTSVSSQGLFFTGNVNSHHMSDLKINFSGKVDPTRYITAEYSVPSCFISSALLPEELPLPANMTFEGTFEARGELSINGKGPDGTFTAALSEGNLTMDDKNLNIAGIQLGITLPSLPSLRSEPSQSLKITSIDLGSLHFTDGLIHYRLDEDKSLFIEKSRFNWCGGKIQTGSIRLTSESPQIETTLYCDRLGFSELLTQLSVTATEGEGSLNGQLPIHFTESGINLDGGFLFSTPGKSGIIEFNDTTMLRDSMPAIDKTGYLDYSLQALESFSYNWTKLTFANKGENLLLAMEIDGKPTTPLPFIYKQGQMRPSTKGAGMQHPVRLNVNFHFPVKDMFEYGQNIQSIMENM